MLCIFFKGATKEPSRRPLASEREPLHAGRPKDLPELQPDVNLYKMRPGGIIFVGMCTPEGGGW